MHQDCYRLKYSTPTISLAPTISLGSHQNIGLHTGARACRSLSADDEAEPWLKAGQNKRSSQRGWRSGHSRMNGVRSTIAAAKLESRGLRLTDHLMGVFNVLEHKYCSQGL